MRKIIATLLALLSLFSLAACSTSKDDGGSAKKEKTVESQIKDRSSKKKDKKDVSKYSIDETTIVDEDGLVIKAVSVESHNEFGDGDNFVVKLSVENGLEEKINVYSEYVVINGYVTEAFGSQTVNAGKRANMEIEVDPYALELQNISEVDQVDLYLSIRNEEGEPVRDANCTLFPTAKKAEDIKVADRVKGDKEVSLVDNEDCCVIIIGEIDPPEYSDGEYTVLCYAENRTDHVIKASFDDVYVNDCAVTSYGYFDAPANTRGYFCLSFDAEDMEDNNITSVESIDISVNVYDSNFDDVVKASATFAP